MRRNSGFDLLFKLFPLFFGICFVLCIVGVVAQIYFMFAVGSEIHTNGLKSVVETIWNGVGE